MGDREEIGGEVGTVNICWVKPLECLGEVRVGEAPFPGVERA